MEMIMLWIIFALMMLLLELVIPGLFYAMAFVLAAFFSAIFAWFGIGFFSQLVMFLCSSLVMLVLVYFVVRKILLTANSSSNVGALIGKRSIVVVALEPHKKGQIKIDGEIWSAREVNNRYCEVGAVVKVVKIVGCHAVVSLETTR